MKTFQVNGISETVLERSDFPADWVRAVLAGEKLAVLGYGTQGRAQALNLRDAGYSVILGQRPGPSHDLARQDGWREGQDLLPLAAAAERGTVLFYLLSDAGQRDFWPALLPLLTPGKALVFAHGFSLAYADQTGVRPPANVDVLLVAPKGSGTTLRRSFVEGRFLNVGFSVHQPATARANARCLALCHAIGGLNFFETTPRSETTCDLVGERGTLLGAIYGLWLAQYEVLRANGHSPLEAFNESVEEALSSLYPLIHERGIDWMYANCSTTAQRGALDWHLRFRDALLPLFAELYQAVASGAEAARALATNQRPDYRRQLEKELAAIADSEMWQAGRFIRELRGGTPASSEPAAG